MAMAKARVSLVRADSYDRQTIQGALEESFKLLGGLEKFVPPRSKVFVKINHLSPPGPPERAIVTHPFFSREILALLKSIDCDVTVGDDIQTRKEDGFQVSGYREMCEQVGVRLVNLKEIGFREIECDGQVLKKIYISPLVLESDFILNLPKLKTHSFTVFTGAIKNMFGVIPNGLRKDYHGLYITNEVFSQMLVDIYSCAPPNLTVMDGIMAMEGEGPGSGKPREVGAVLVSQDGVAVDAVSSQIIGFNPKSLYTSLIAHERGIGIGDLKEIEILGEKLNDVKIKNFKHSVLATGMLRRRFPQFMHAFIQRETKLIPEISLQKCTNCMECVNICPTSAAHSTSDIPAIDKRLCIQCMCCHEVCRFYAINLKRSFFGNGIEIAAKIYRFTGSLFSKGLFSRS
jgi:uncharacterized protein (DUF362 family)/Pyruvate/2-oxoacid:ferredoxin oxidoreductase delta subunit